MLKRLSVFNVAFGRSRGRVLSFLLADGRSDCVQ